MARRVKSRNPIRTKNPLKSPKAFYTKNKVVHPITAQKERLDHPWATERVKRAEDLGHQQKIDEINRFWADKVLHAKGELKGLMKERKKAIQKEMRKWRDEKRKAG
jgi:hypothetical protein